MNKKARDALYSAALPVISSGLVDLAATVASTGPQRSCSPPVWPLLTRRCRRADRRNRATERAREDYDARQIA